MHQPFMPVIPLFENILYVLWMKVLYKWNESRNDCYVIFETADLKCCKAPIAFRKERHSKIPYYY